MCFCQWWNTWCSLLCHVESWQPFLVTGFEETLNVHLYSYLQGHSVMTWKLIFQIANYLTTNSNFTLAFGKHTLHTDFFQSRNVQFSLELLACAYINITQHSIVTHLIWKKRYDTLIDFCNLKGQSMTDFKSRFFR